MKLRQFVLCCPCGDENVRAQGLCARCYQARRLSRKRFNGERDTVIVRDGGKCVLCASPRVIVHRRSTDKFVTLCVQCHPRIHRTVRPRYREIAGLARELWREQHPDIAEQLELEFAPAPPAPVQTLLFAAREAHSKQHSQLCLGCT